MHPLTDPWASTRAATPQTSTAAAATRRGEARWRDVGALSTATQQRVTHGPHGSRPECRPAENTHTRTGARERSEPYGTMLRIWEVRIGAIPEVSEPFEDLVKDPPR
ncbi:hypothetical protein Vafri_11165, partial [Volvox africanus]